MVPHIWNDWNRWTRRTIADRELCFLLAGAPPLAGANHRRLRRVDGALAS
jgi:hypothetical protein